VDPSFHHSIIPSLSSEALGAKEDIPIIQYSIIPIFQYSNIPVFLILAYENL